jgi:hypothetical protein
MIGNQGFLKAIIHFKIKKAIQHLGPGTLLRPNMAKTVPNSNTSPSQGADNNITLLSHA